MSAKSGQKGYVKSGRLNVYYDIEGAGLPLLLFHGGMATIEMLRKLRDALNRNWMTIGVEQQAHGHTADIDRPLAFTQMADDTATVIHELRLGKCHAFGFSDGGNVALGLAIRHPELVDRVVLSGANATVDGLTAEMFRKLSEGAKQDPTTLAATLPKFMREEFEAVNPKPENWPLLVHKVFVQASEFEGWSDDQLQSIGAPVLAIVGDHDVVTVDHSLWLSRIIPKGQLCVLPHTDHLAPVSRANWISVIVSDYLTEDLDAPMPMEASHE